MKLSHKVAIAGAVGVAVAVANYCWNWWKKGDEEKTEGNPKENDHEKISIIPASRAIPLMPESVSLKEENVKANPMMMSDSETLKEAVKESPLAPRFIIKFKDEKPQRGIYYPCEVDEIGPVDALIDTGATACIVRKDVLTSDSIKSKIEPLSDFKATLFDGISKMDILGYVFLCVSYLGEKVEIPFFVVAEPCELPMILGTTWIRKSRAILQSDGTKLAVTFGGKKEKTEAVLSLFSCSSPYVSVDVVDGMDKVRALVDSGSKLSFIRSDILTEPQKAMAIPTSDRATMANNAEIKGVQEIISLNITFGGIITCLENVHIISNMDDKLVLGMDWIDKTHAVIQSDGSEIIVSLPDS